MLSKIFLAILAIVALFLGYVAMLPSLGSITRSAVIAAPPEAIYPHINSLKQWEAWSPWAKLDPKAKNSLAGPESGVGSTLSWDGNSDVGTGRMTIVQSDPNKRVRLHLNFLKPMTSSSVAEFTLQPEGAGTRVNWTMSGERPYLARIMCVLFRADAMVGGMFEKGLASLGAVATKK